jgi:hypothetical protein
LVVLFGIMENETVRGHYFIAGDKKELVFGVPGIGG